jgi:uncharacterized protein DUF4231
VPKADNTEVEAIGKALDALDLPDVQRQQLKARYLDYVVWLQSNATGSRRWYYTMRLIAAVGSVVVASMSSAQVLGSPPRIVAWILLGTSLGTGVALAIDGFLNLGERWRHYRAAAEILKSQGWRFIQRTAPYDNLDDTDAARRFAGDVEELIAKEIGEYVKGPSRPAPPPGPNS